jgi:hypothetical protein
MADMRYSLVAYLEILTPAGEPDAEGWDALSRRIHGSPVAFQREAGARGMHLLGNQMVRVQHLDARFQREPAVRLFVLVELASLQAMLGRQGVFVRGAVADGEVQVSRAAIVGPGIRAAQEQARQERVPRLVVSPGILQALAPDPLLPMELPRAETDLIRLIRRFLTQDSDGLWFVDYPAFQQVATKDPQEYLDWLDEHARQIEGVLARIDARGEDARDWLWLATQHDRVVDGLEGIDERTRASLRITSDTPQRFRF